MDWLGFVPASCRQGYAPRPLASLNKNSHTVGDVKFEWDYDRLDVQRCN